MKTCMQCSGEAADNAAMKLQAEAVMTLQPEEVMKTCMQCSGEAADNAALKLQADAEGDASQI